MEKLEELKRSYSKLIQEYGQRNISADEKGVGGLIQNLSEMVVSDEIPEDKIIEIAKEVEAAMVWLSEQEVMKTEDGEKYPAEAYAYVPDKESPSTWKLRLWESLDKKITRAQLGRAAAALSPGGFRGNKVEIPEADIPAVKRIIRTEYRNLEVADEDIPRWVKEADKRELVGEYLSLSEAKVSGQDTADIIVIKSGFNTSKSRYYPLEVLNRGCKLFEGVKMYADHPSQSEETNRPERSIRDWVATLKNTRVSDGMIVGEAQIIEPWFKEKLAILRDANLLNEMGVSIRAVGKTTAQMIDGVKTNFVEDIVKMRSVDFVTEPGAGGMVTMYEKEEFDIDIIGVESLKERRPDLVSEISKELQEAKIEMENELEKLKKDNEAIILERDALRKQVDEVERFKNITETRDKLNEALSQSDLPEPSKQRILSEYKEAVSIEDIDSVVQKERDYLAMLKESGNIKDFGKTKEPEVNLEKSVRRLYPSWTDEQIKLFINGG